MSKRNKKSYAERCNDYTIDVTIKAWKALLSDAPISRNASPEFRRRLDGWYRKANKFFDETPFGELCAIMDERKTQLLESLTRSSFTDSKPVFIKEIATMPVIGKVYIDFIKDVENWSSYDAVQQQRSSERFRWLNSILRFGLKAVVSDKTLEEVALSNWVSNEKRLKDIRLPRYLVKVMGLVAKAIIPSFTFDTVLPRHGSGSVADRDIDDIVDKVNMVKALPPWTMKLYFPDHKRNRRTISKGWTRESWANLLGDITGTQQFAVPSVLRFVAKSRKAVRTICKEPAALMMMQQSVLNMFVHTFEETELKHFIDLSDQSRNRNLALSGSRYNHLTTVDMKDASDNIKASLVRRVLPYSIWKHLEATRSKVVQLPDDSLVQPCKFAPMGSATCFPTQSIIFTVLGITSYLCWHYGSQNLAGIYDDRIFQGPEYDPNLLDIYLSSIPGELLNNPEELRKWIAEHISKSADGRGYKKYGRLVAYGDDVILDAHVSGIFVSLSELIGFVVNKNKTFTADSAFRESCGIEALMGYDVTPVYWKTPNVMGPTEPTLHQSLIALSNRAMVAGYSGLRRFSLELVLYTNLPGIDKTASGINPYEFTTDPTKSDAILTLHSLDVNWHLRKRNPFIDETAREYELLVSNIDLELRKPEPNYAYVREMDLTIQVKYRHLTCNHVSYERIAFVPDKDDGEELKKVRNDDYKYALSRYKHGSDKPESMGADSKPEFIAYMRRVRRKVVWTPLYEHLTK